MKKLTDPSIRSAMSPLRDDKEALKLPQLHKMLFSTSAKLHKGWGWICFHIDNISSDRNKHLIDSVNKA